LSSIRGPLRGIVLTIAEALAGLVRLLVPVRPKSVRLEAVTVRVPDLPAGLEGYTIGVLSDLHLGPIVPDALVRHAAMLVAARRPDLIVVPGDVISKSAAAPRVDVALAPIGKAYGVYGNWDHTRHLALRGQRTIRFLLNDGLEVAPGLWLAGIDETIFGRPDLKRALAGAPEGAVRILLCHEPDFADRVRPEHRVALQISGHSHGGQIRLPWFGPMMLPRSGRKYHTGLNQALHCQVYTSRGVGMVHIPLRVNCPPEATLIKLTRYDATAAN
jgi:uncharacterized protein